MELYEIDCSLTNFKIITLSAACFCKKPHNLLSFPLNFNINLSSAFWAFEATPHWTSVSVLSLGLSGIYCASFGILLKAISSLFTCIILTLSGIDFKTLTHRPIFRLDINNNNNIIPIFPFPNWRNPLCPIAKWINNGSKQNSISICGSTYKSAKYASVLIENSKLRSFGQLVLQNNRKIDGDACFEWRKKKNW